MTESNILTAECTSCKKIIHPYGYSKTTVPATANVTCPWCNHSDLYEWYDSETTVKLTQRKLGLLNDNLETVQELKKRIDLLDKELIIEKGRRELVEAKMNNLEQWKQGREQMFKEIEAFYNEEKQFREDNK